MERVIDKFILYLSAAYLLFQTMTGVPLIIAVYMTLAAMTAELWLIPETEFSLKRGERSLFKHPEVGGLSIKGYGLKWILSTALLDFGAVAVLLQNNLFGILPLIVYDLLLCRHYLGLGIAGVSFISTVAKTMQYENPSWFVTGVTAVTLFLSIWLYRKSSRILTDDKKILRLRDDDEEQRQMMNHQNEQLLMARDSEVETAQLAERNRIARDIHDNVGHTLSRALLQVGALLAIHKEEPVHSELSGVRETLDNAMNSIRASVHDLHDSSIDLSGTIRQMLEPLQGEFHVQADLDASQDMPRDIKYGIIGIVRECISNILRHSRNDTVQVSIIEHPAFYQLVVHDYLSEEGERRAYPVAGKESGTPGIGVTNMETRARNLGGTVRISEENGYRVFVSIPKKS